MENNVEFESLKNEVLKKIGKLVMSFQQIEHLLKNLNTYGVSSGYVSELDQKLRERENKILHGKNYTLGSGVLDYKKHFLSPERVTEEQKKEDPWFSYKCRIEWDDSFSKEKQDTFNFLLTERNYLIHNLLSDWDFLSFESTKKIVPYLDQLQEKLVPEILFLQSHIKQMQEGLKEYNEFIGSDEGIKIFELAPLRESLHVQSLFDFAMENKRTDGWVVLNNAQNYIKKTLAKKAFSEELFSNEFTTITKRYNFEEFNRVIEKMFSDDLAKIKKRYGFTKLEKILEATDWFDIGKEETTKGGVRVLYRIKPNLIITDEHITWPTFERRLNS